ncbi:MAG: PAS domain-containing protein, partial [Alphaproteobacteria bacterium]|nr:PAS domain-containing protein [Alphaproteobacteria bacterium]
MLLNELTPATKNCHILATAWCGWRGDKMLPFRSDVRLEDIKEILPWITLIEVFSESEIIFRLAGTMVREIMGVELTGRDLLELTEPG